MVVGFLKHLCGRAGGGVLKTSEMKGQGRH